MKKSKTKIWYKIKSKRTKIRLWRRMMAINKTLSLIEQNILEDNNKRAFLLKVLKEYSKIYYSSWP